MYKFVVSTACAVAMLLTSYYANACSVCGCNMSNFNPELMMNNGAHSIGLFNQTRWYTARLHAHGPDTQQGEYDNYGQMHSLYELRGSWYVNNRWSITGILPLSHKYIAREGDRLETPVGLGDITVLAQYIAVRDGKKMAAKGFEQRLVVGAGIKAPTGTFNNIGYEEEIDPRLQNGTGSVDFLFMASYFVKMRKLAFTTNVVYKANTANNNAFRFGNSFNTDLKMLYVHNFKKFTLAPSVGARVELAGVDMDNGEPYGLDTGGKTYLASAGFECYYNNVSFSASYLHPVLLQLEGEQFEMSAGLQAGIRYTFNKVKKEQN